MKLTANIVAQFRQAKGRDPWQWGFAPQLPLLALIAVSVFILLWFLFLDGMLEDLAAKQAQEQILREEFLQNYRKAVNLEALKKQKEQISENVILLKKQLPNKEEMAALLSEINLAGVKQGLMFDLFKPGTIEVKPYYAEQRIDIEVRGRYEALAKFTSNLANMPRIVTLADMNIQKNPQTSLSDMLTMQTVVKTYRYLDQDEEKKKK